jgi:hypothetical protein
MKLLTNISLDDKQERFHFTIVADQELHQFTARVIVMEDGSGVRAYELEQPGQLSLLLNSNAIALENLYTVFRILYSGENIELPFVIDES